MFSSSVWSSGKKGKQCEAPTLQKTRTHFLERFRYKQEPILQPEHTTPVRQPSEAPPLSRADYIRLLFQNGISSSITPRAPIVSRDEVTRASERTRAEILAAEHKKAEEYAVKLSEQAALLARVNQQMADQPNEPKAVVIGEEMDVEEDASAALIAARRNPVDESELQTVRDILKNRNLNGQTLVIDKFNIDITISKLVCLKPNTWLNDEIVNFYMCMLQERDQKLCAESNGTRLPSHYFNSFFIAKLLENGQYTYGNVKRWSKKFDVFAMDRIFMPINLNNTHWVMSVAFIQRKEIHYYDSMSGSGQRHLQAILRWLGDESKEKKKTELDTTGWKLIDREQDVPQQENGYDCGVFSIICADFKSDDLPLQYEQSEMSLNRVKIGAAIRRGYLTY